MQASTGGVASRVSTVNSASHSACSSCYEPAKESYRTLLRTYLSRAHAEQAETGCPVAALGSEIPRQAPYVSVAATRYIKCEIQLVAHYAPDRYRPGALANALENAATMIGALVLACAVPEERLEVPPGADARTKLVSLTLAGWLAGWQSKAKQS